MKLLKFEEYNDDIKEKMIEHIPKSKGCLLIFNNCDNNDHLSYTWFGLSDELAIAALEITKNEIIAVMRSNYEH